MDRFQNALAAFAVLAVAAVVFAASGEASFRGAGETLFFTAHDRASGGPGHVYSIRRDGSGLTELTGGAASDLWVRDAPGGRLVVARDTGEACGTAYWAQGYDLFTLNPDGSGVVRLTDNCPTSESTPAWSPSGRHVVFSRLGELWSMRSDGTDLAKLTCNPVAPGRQDPGDYAPDWSPSGAQIAFDRYGDVDLMTVTGAGVQRVATGSSPSFSPDGAMLTYAGPPFSAAQGIHVLTLASGEDVRLTTGYDGSPTWSPDGTTIAFVHVASVNPALTTQVQTIGADGNGLRTIMDTLNASMVDWSSDTVASASEPDVTAADTACAETAPVPPPPTLAPVVQAPLAEAAQAGITAAAVASPNRLHIDAVAFRPLTLSSRRPFALTVAVRDLVGRAVRGAVVRARPLRSDAAASALLLTRADGTVTLRIVPNHRLQLAAGRRLVLTIQARRPQDGWSSSQVAVRLVSVRTSPPAGR